VDPSGVRVGWAVAYLWRVAATSALGLTLLPGARELLALQARALPQRDDLCGAFCGALALGAAGLVSREGEPLDQDAVAVAAGSTISPPRGGALPHGEPGRRDYRVALPELADWALSGTTAGGVVRALNELSGGAVAAVPYSGRWTRETLGGLFEVTAGMSRPATLIANLATRYLWGGRPSAAEVLAELLDGDAGGPEPDWDVGHFVCVFGRVDGPGGSLYGVADTYPALGDGGVHLQPPRHLAAAIERRELPAGGVIAVVAAEEAAALRAGAAALGLREGLWDNGSVEAGAREDAGEAPAGGAVGDGEEERRRRGARG